MAIGQRSVGFNEKEHSQFENRYLHLSFLHQPVQKFPQIKNKKNFFPPQKNAQHCENVRKIYERDLAEGAIYIPDGFRNCRFPKTKQRKWKTFKGNATSCGRARDHGFVKRHLTVFSGRKCWPNGRASTALGPSFTRETALLFGGRGFVLLFHSTGWFAWPPPLILPPAGPLVVFFCRVALPIFPRISCFALDRPLFQN